MLTLTEMAAKGERKLRAKAATISASWEAAKSRMKAGYDATPFGPTRKSNYKAAIDVAKHRLDIDKWRRNWEAKMKE
jgi:hypothetical protein